MCAGGVSRRASAWLAELHSFVSRLLADLPKITPRGAAGGGAAAALAAQVLQAAHGELDGVGQLCEPEALAARLEDAPPGERLIRAAESDYLAGVAAREVAAPRRLMPVSRVPYMSHFAHRVCL